MGHPNLLFFWGGGAGGGGGGYNFPLRPTLAKSRPTRGIDLELAGTF